MEIKDFSNNHLDDIISIEKRSFKNPWTKEMFLSSANNKLVSFKIVFEDGVLAGYCLYWTVCGETEILSIAVDAVFRRRSLAKNMLAFMEEDSRRSGSEIVFLDVRESNIPAINLYLSFGFEKIGLRKKYYTDEDAIVLRKNIK